MLNISIPIKKLAFVITAKEIDEEVAAALKKITLLGIPVLNQSVLLKGVNDDVETLKNLSQILTDNAIIPYYLHQLDRVDGSTHFEVNESKGHELIKSLQECLPGYAVPRYVQEISGEKSKTALIPK